jgi:type II secretory pathway component GspD/PulD (secretin)
MNVELKTNRFFPFLATVVVAGAFVSTSDISPSFAQAVGPGIGLPVQLPSTTTFGIRTNVMVPDAGAARLGGVQRGASGWNSTGIPMLSNLPGSAPLFRNQASGHAHSASQASARVHVILNKEIEENVLAEAERRMVARREADPNGSPETQQRAAFLTRNMGRR